MATQKNMLPLLGVLAFLVSPHVLSQSFDLRSLSPEQQEKLLKLQQSGGAASLGVNKQTQIAPVSAPPKKNTEKSKEEVPGFAAQPGSLKPRLEPFGAGLFSGSDIPFSAATDMPVPADYVIGAGDVVELRMFGKENRTFQLPVDRSGVITLPDIGPMSVAGMSFESMGKAVLERIAKQKIGVEATVSMGPLRSIQVFLMGDVNNPGAYATDAMTTVVNALLVGGGIKQSGSLRRVEVRRQGALVARVDLYETMLRGGNKANMRLQSGDTIFVPPVGRRVGIEGDVLRPAIYELLSEKTAEDMLSLAGGLLPTAFPAQAKLDRVGQTGGRQFVDLPLATPVQRRFELRDGDVLNIPSVVARWDKSVVLDGSVARVGSHEWRPDLHLGQLISSFDQLAVGAYRPLAIIERTEQATGSRRFLTVNLLKVINQRHIEPLQPQDRVIILGHTDLEFLSAANVQNVLLGRLPIAEKGVKSVVSNNQSQEFEKPLAAKVFDTKNFDKKLSIENTELTRTFEEKSESSGIKKTELTGVKDTCTSLIELSDIVSREGFVRFRGALISSNSASDEKRLIKNVSCPEVFEKTPALLPFVLENAVTVRGEVKQPGILPVPEGISLEVVLGSRGGLTREAETSVEVSRLVSGTQGRAQLKRHLVKPEEFSALTLEPGNLVLVRKRFSEMEAGSVRLSGEFAHPGVYEIRRGEKFSELIARAGGITHHAYPLGAVFLRDRIKEEKKQYYEKAAFELQNGIVMAMTRMRAGASSGDAGAAPMVANLVSQIRAIDPVGRMVIEADPTVLQVRPEMDVLVEPGDTIHLPRRPSTILVMGEVQNPGAVQFQSGKKASEYIAAVGGVTQMANEDRVFAILPNGSAEPLKLSSWNFQPTLLPPGSTIYVSRDNLPTTSIDVLQISLQVIKDLALAAASLSVISK